MAVIEERKTKDGVTRYRVKIRLVHPTNAYLQRVKVLSP